jgi:tellurium resistance protein TerZ
MAGINLKKNESINLTKNASKGLESVCVGLDWGMIKKGGFFGIGATQESVDLDASIIIYDENKSVIDTIYYGNKRGQGIRHLGDDLTGDADDDDSDNEIIMCDLTNVDPRAKTLMVVIHSFSGQNFYEIPYTRIRVYTGTANNPTEILGSLNLSNESAFNDKIAMVMGAIEKINGEWNFRAIGKSTTDYSIDGTRTTAKQFI